MSITLQDIQTAQRRIGSCVVNTRFEKSSTLSAILDTQLYIKFENMQFTASFKDRGALNKLLDLQSQGLTSGVIAMSAGNHAKAVAYHAQRLQIPATIVMPKFTPNVKVEDTRNFSATVILRGNSLDAAAEHARQVAADEKLTFIHPYNDELVMAGQGTVALEILAAEPDLDVIVVPIGGGGLIAGVATAAKAIKPSIKIIGVEVMSYPGVYNALGENSSSNGEPVVPHKGGTTIAEGIAVKQPGALNLEVINRLVDEVLLVSEEDIEEAISLYVSIEKTIAEGAGAASLAAIMANQQLFYGKKVALILSGANIDSRILASVLMRNLVRSGRIVRYVIKIDDSPGILSDVTATVGKCGGNILEVSHQRMFAHVRVKEADLHLTVETRDAAHSEEILTAMRKLGYLVDLILE